MNDMTRYTMPAEKDVHRWVFVDGLAPEVECTVRKWLHRRLNGFQCDLQAMYMPHLRLHPIIQARTHIVLLGPPPLHAMAKGDEAVSVDARGLNARDAVKALMKATGLNPYMSVCGWPFRSDDMERGMI